jgi:hypothetical protein
LGNGTFKALKVIFLTGLSGGYKTALFCHQTRPKQGAPGTKSKGATNRNCEATAFFPGLPEEKSFRCKALCSLLHPLLHPLKAPLAIKHFFQKFKPKKFLLKKFFFKRKKF